MATFGLEFCSTLVNVVKLINELSLTIRTCSNLMRALKSRHFECTRITVDRSFVQPLSVKRVRSNEDKLTRSVKLSSTLIEIWNMFKVD